MNIYQAEHLDFVFRQVSKLHNQTVQRLMADKELFPGQPPLLRALSVKDGRSQKELADEMQITPATLNVMIGRMEKNGLVARRADPSDQRVSRVFITDKGRRAHLEMKAIIAEMDRTCFETFTPEERIVFRRLLLQMYENLKHAEPGGAEGAESEESAEGRDRRPG